MNRKITSVNHLVLKKMRLTRSSENTSPSFYRIATLIVAMISLSGCATLSQEECMVADWYSIGFEDGAQGRQAGYLANHREACAEYGVAPDLSAYQSGRDQGLDTYCNYDNGYALGAGGGTYRGVCPARLEKMFLDGFNRGRDLYTLKQEAKKIRQEISSAETEIKTLDELISKKQNELIADDVDTYKRALLLEEVLKARTKRKDTVDQKDLMEWDLQQLEEKINSKSL